MSMDVMPDELEIVCPACGANFSLDPAFAGSICRCGSCGALVSIEIELPQSEITNGVRHDDPRLHMTAADIHPTSLSEDRAMAGRSVVAYQRDIKPRQLGKRLAVLTVVVGCMAGGIGGASMLVMQRDASVKPIDAQRQNAIESNTQGNDLASHAPEFWGVALDSPCIVLIDATLASESWLEEAKKQVKKVHGILQESNVAVTFAFFDGMSIQMQQFDSGQPLPAAFDQIKPQGSLLVSDALSRLGSLNFSRLVLVSSQSLTGDQVHAMGIILPKEVRLDLVWLDELPDGLAELVTSTHGGIWLR